MCGIAGTWNRDGTPIEVERLVAAARALRHRGPDDEGFFLARDHDQAHFGSESSADALGLPHVRGGGVAFGATLGLAFRRLSIVDLSPAGHQPMSTPDGRFTVVFNGEIYNYRELRGALAQEGWQFRSASDTEVLLAAYARWGSACADRLNGMWAIALWDAEKQSLWLSRDRFGVKPLYFRADGPRFSFASEAKGLFPFSASTPLLRDDVIATFLSWGQLPEERGATTAFHGVQAVPPGHSLLVTRDHDDLRRHYTLPAEGTTLPEAEAVPRFAEILRSAVELRTHADVPVGSCLSGGLDSSTIVRTIADLATSASQRTFSAVYGDGGRHDESAFIAAARHGLEIEAYEVVPTVDDLRATLRRIVWHQELPFPTSSIYAQWCVMRLGREHGTTVLLDGQGADEVLGGYLETVSVAVADASRSSTLSALRLALSTARGVGVSLTPTLLRAALWRVPPAARLGLVRLALSRRARILRPAWQDVAATGYLQSLDSSRDDYAAHLRYGIEARLPHLLRYEDRNSMAFSIEARTPFLDYRLVAFVLQHAPALRLHAGWTKWILRAAMASRLPSAIVWRRGKVGFETPERRWLRQWPDRRELEAVPDRLAPWVEPAHARQAMRRAVRGEGSAEESRLAWRLLVTDAFLDAFGAVSAA